MRNNIQLIHCSSLAAHRGSKLVLISQCAASNRALSERQLDRSENSNSDIELNVSSRVLSAMYSFTASRVIMNFRVTFVWHRSRSPSRAFEPRVVLSVTQRDVRHTANSPTSIQRSCTTAMYPAAVQLLVPLSAAIQMSNSFAEDTETSVAAVRRTRIIAA